jgi:hypothetical protein
LSRDFTAANKAQAEQPVLRSRLVQLGLRVSRGFQRANNLDC